MAEEAPQPVNRELLNRINDNTRRIRTIETRSSRSENRISAVEERIIDEVEELRKGFDQIVLDLKELSNTLNLMHSEMGKVNKKVGKAATKAEIKEVSSLMDIWNPVRSVFVTRDEAERMVEVKIEELLAKTKSE